jgi:hypothetical protein
MKIILIRINSQVFAFFSDVLLFDMKYRSMCYAKKEAKITKPDAISFATTQIYTLHFSLSSLLFGGYSFLFFFIRLHLLLASVPTVWCQQK